MAAISSYNSSLTVPINGMNSFTLDLYQQCIRSTNENVIFSPLSILNALTLLSQATDGNTFNELQKGLYLNENKTVTANQFYEHSRLVRQSIGQGNLSIANRIYLRNGSALNKHFQEVATTKFSSGIESVNFANNSETAQTINRFVEEKTHGKIKNLIEPNAIDEHTAVMLINAIHFKADWLYKFEDRHTTVGNFFMDESKKAHVQFMSVTNHFRRKYLNDLDATALELKYAESKFAFIIILPGTRTGLPPLEAILKNYDLSQIADNLWEPFSMNVIIPKFKADFNIKLNDALKKLGMIEMFDEEKANLSGLLESDEILHVSDVIHKAFIEVNEAGTEAAAATSVGIDFRMDDEESNDFPTFRADHPFLYYIWDTESKSVIFIGHITKFN